MNSAIDIRNMSKRYGSTVALNEISFSVPEASVFGLIGPDGAGKSTLYRILTTLTPPDSGSAFVTGLDVVKDYRAIRRQTGYMPERFSLYPDLTVSENIRFYASLFGVSVKDSYDFIAPFFGQVSQFPNRRAGALSGGMKQKLALVCALIHRPKVLLLDEPTTGVDAVSRSELWDSLSRLKQMGITVMVSTSYMDEAELCERIALIDRGRILEVDSPANIRARMGENLYNASARQMYPLLEALRALPDVKYCYTFGSTLHLVAASGFAPDAAARALTDKGLTEVKIYPAQATIEDKFIQLAGHDT